MSQGTSAKSARQPTGKPKIKIRPAREVIFDLYVSKKLNTSQIAPLFSVAPASVARWLQFYGIETRKPRPMPSRDELFGLYVLQGLTSVQVANALHVSPGSVLQWVAHYGFVKHTVPGSLADKGFTKPTREQLEEMIHIMHLSYAEIGVALGGITDVAVKDWVRKFKIACPNGWVTRKKKVVTLPTADELRELHLDKMLGFREIGQQFGLGMSHISRLCRQYKIVARPPGSRSVRYIAADGHEVMSSYELAVDNWLQSRDISHEYSPRLPFCRYRADFRCGDVYIEIWGVVCNDGYERRKALKKEHYVKHGIRLIELEPIHFRDDSWETILERINV